MTRIMELKDFYSVLSRLVNEFQPISDVRGILAKKGVLHKLYRSPKWVPASYAAVDSAFPKSPIYLVGGTLSIVAVASIWLVSGERSVDRNVRSWLIAEEQGELDQDYIAAFARLAERREALRLINEVGVDALIVDGELVPRKGRSPLWDEVMNLSYTMLNRRNICLAGVLKRSYSYSISRQLGLTMSDRVLASASLRRGEAIIVAHSNNEMKQRGCFEALYKPLRGLPTAIRVELCGCETLELLSWLASSAGPSGLPWPIDLVDSLAKQEASKIAAVETLMLSKLARRELHHLGYTANPQETMRRRREDTR